MDRKRIIIDSQEVSYLDNGIESDGVLLFLHGWGQNAHNFDSIMSTFSNERVVAIDFPGFGESPEPEEVWGVKDYSTLVAKFIQQMELKNVTVVAHSFGARVSFYLVQEAPEIRRMVLTGAAGVKPKRDLKYRLSVGSYKFKKFLVSTPLYSQYKEDLLNGSGSSDYQNATPRMKEVLIKVVNEDLVQLFASVDVPVSLFWGRHDDATPLSDGEFMERVIPDSELEVVDGTHYAFLEHSDRFIRMIKSR